MGSVKLSIFPRCPCLDARLGNSLAECGFQVTSRSPKSSGSELSSAWFNSQPATNPRAVHCQPSCGGRSARLPARVSIARTRQIDSRLEPLSCDTVYDRGFQSLANKLAGNMQRRKSITGPGCCCILTSTVGPCRFRSFAETPAVRGMNRDRKKQAMILPLGAIRRNGRLQHSLSVYESPLRFQGPGDHARDSAGRQSLSCETMAANRWVESETWMGECE